MFHALEFYQGKDIDSAALAARLVEFGYRRVDQTREEGDFSIRGGVIDIFPSHYSLPIRIVLESDTVENIWTFDIQSGERLESHRMLLLLPAKLGRRPSRTRAVPDYLSEIGNEQVPIDPFVDIKPGDYVVHLLHGIARYRGIKPIRAQSNTEEDHLVLEFDEKNLLYVPLRDLSLVQRYISFGKVKPPLSKLGSKTWEKLKANTKKGVLSFAAELLALGAKRKALVGYAFPKDTEWQAKLEKEFPFEDTPDQARAVKEVKADLESTCPMDRLLCGDVGYGKTEVALRAAFKVMMSGKQVAILVPTTLLAEQHYETFTQRMRSFPVNIRMLSRFQSRSNQDAIVLEIASGSCDIVIGTHRLLSPDIAFKDLGLVIIDEEQRFGVKHKEHLKRLRLLVDVLTLTATPIPRTLYLSLVGARDMSTINTPPAGRQPVKTVVAEANDKIIREAIHKELDRKGQVFFIHNRVQGIERIAKKIAELAPDARIAVGHGQMPAKALEKVMHDFIHGEIDVLVSTTIVESGIDIPNANTLIVNRADNFGLSELYQLRGRVGRFTRSAYAYFLIPKNASLSEETLKRLDAIERFTYLGSGFNVAMEDLEIRGAGNILGVEQHGHIVNVGFDLYCRILRDAVAELKKQNAEQT